jgi:hypothetical protein
MWGENVNRSKSGKEYQLAISFSFNISMAISVCLDVVNFLLVI